MSEVASATQTNWLRIIRLYNAWDKAIGVDKFSILSIASDKGAKVKLQPLGYKWKRVRLSLKDK